MASVNHQYIPSLVVRQINEEYWNIATEALRGSKHNTEVFAHQHGDWIFYAVNHHGTVYRKVLHYGVQVSYTPSSQLVPDVNDDETVVESTVDNISPQSDDES